MSKGDEAGMYKSGENETFDGYNIPVALAAKIMGKDQQYIRQGLVQGILPIGTAFKREGSKHYDYYISPKLFYEFTDTKLIIVNSISKITKGVSI